MSGQAPGRRGLVWLPVAALVIAGGFLAVAWSQGVADGEAYQARRAATIARGVAWVHVQEAMRVDDAGAGQTQRFVEALPDKVPGVREALVLKGVNYKAHSDPAQVDQRLDVDSLAAKALYDDARRLKANVDKNAEERARNPALGYDPYPEVQIIPVEGGLQALAVAEDAGKYIGTARITTGPAPYRFELPWLVLLVALGLSALWLIVGGRLPTRPRIAVGVLALAGLTVAGSVTLPEWRSDLRRAQADGQAKTLAALDEAGLLAAQAPPWDPEEWADLDEDEQQEETARIEANALMPYLDRGLDGAIEGRLVTIARANEGDDARLEPPAGLPAGSLMFAAEGRAVYFSGAAFDAAVVTDEADVRLWGIGFGVIGLLILLLGELGQLRRMGRAAVDHRGAYGYLSPAIVGMVILVFIPVVYGIVLGFTQRTYNIIEFAGLTNYLEILTDFDLGDPTNFYFKLGVTLMWTILNVGLHVSIGLFLAVLLNDQMLKARGIYRVILIVPWAIPNYITALIWKGMFNKQFGAVNAFIEMMGGESLSWFQSFWPAFSTNLITNTWLGFPFMMVVCLGALQSIPSDLYEAAWVDGADRWQRFRRITLPLLMPALVPAVIVGAVWTFNMFNIIYLVSGGAPNGATDILITDAYRWAFERDRYGYAAAYSTIIFLILLGFTLITNRITGATKGAFE